MRHQLYLFPSLLIFLAAGLDRLLGWVGSGVARTGILLLVIVGLTSGLVAGSKPFFTFRDEMAREQVLNLWRVFPEPSAVYVDQFSLVAFFSAYHDWTWHFTRTCPTNSWIQQYTLTRGRQVLMVFRDRSRWEVDLRAENSGKDLRGCLESVAPRPVVVFALRQFPGEDKKDWLISSGGLTRASASLANGGVRVRKAAVTPSAGFVELRLGPAAERNPPQVVGAASGIAIARAGVNPPAGATFTCWIKGSGFQSGDKVLVNGKTEISTTFGDPGLVTFAGGVELLQGRTSLSLVVFRPGTKSRSNAFDATIPPAAPRA